VVGLEGLHVMRRLTSLPVFAIGGIQIDHVRDVMRAGVDGVAVISAILKAPDISHAVKSFLAQT
jgi:thiamine-phosphate pyrophosphorylase